MPSFKDNTVSESNRKSEKKSLKDDTMSESGLKEKKSKKDDGSSKKRKERSDVEGSSKKRKVSEEESVPTGVPVVDAAAFVKEHEIVVKMSEDRACPEPMVSFSSTPFSSKFMKTFANEGFANPTALQAMAWPLVLANDDVVAVSKTGSGKTLGFLVPTFHQMVGTSAAAPQLLVIAPTRELAMQIEGEARKFGIPLGIRVCCLYGGSPKYAQIRALESQVHAIIATPGRLCDLMDMRKVNLSKIKYLVLDEADRMLEMGFEPDVIKITEVLPKNRQSLFFTATWPKTVQRMADKLLTRPTRLNFGSGNALQANKSVTQHIMIVEESDKRHELEKLITRLSENGAHPKMIIFTSTKAVCEKLSNQLWDDKFAVDSLNGDREQWERTEVMKKFTKGDLQMLVATDVAARGLDVKDIKVVINYDFPGGVEDYVHRIGRTGRAGLTGDAYTFFNKGNKKHAGDLIKVLKTAEQNVPSELLSWGRYGSWSGSSGGKGGSWGGGKGRSGGKGGGKGGKGARRW